MIAVEPPRGRGATREHTRRYVTEEQRSPRGWIDREGERVIHSRALSLGTSLGTRGPRGPLGIFGRTMRAMRLAFVFLIACAHAPAVLAPGDHMA